MERFKHRTQVRVRNFEIDWQGVVHNAIYLLYFETGRIEYLKQVGIPVDAAAINKTSRIVLVRNEINYRTPAHFDDLLDIFTRLMYIHDSSFAFEGIIRHSATERLIAENVAVHVWLDARTGEPVTVTEEFRRKIEQFEGSDVAIVRPPQYT